MCTLWAHCVWRGCAFVYVNIGLSSPCIASGWHTIDVVSSIESMCGCVQEILCYFFAAAEAAAALKWMRQVYFQSYIDNCIAHLNGTLNQLFECCVWICSSMLFTFLYLSYRFSFACSTLDLRPTMAKKRTVGSRADSFACCFTFVASRFFYSCLLFFEAFSMKIGVANTQLSALVVIDGSMDLVVVTPIFQLFSMSLQRRLFSSVSTFDCCFAIVHENSFAVKLATSSLVFCSGCSQMLTQIIKHVTHTK